MGATLANPTAARRPVLPDIGRPRMAKADVRKPDSDESIRKTAAAIQRAVLRVWDTNQLAAAEFGVDDAEFGKWMTGTRRAHMDRLLNHPRLHQPLLVELASLDDSVEVVTEIRFVRRRA